MRVLVIVLVLLSVLVVGCADESVSYQSNQQPSSNTNGNPSQQMDYEEAVSSEFIDESDDVTIGEMV